MEPKKKSALLVLSYMAIVVKMDIAKECAVLAVDEILKTVDDQLKGWLDSDVVAYWNEVKKEINKL